MTILPQSQVIRGCDLPFKSVKGEAPLSPLELAEYFCANSKLRIERLFEEMGENTDRAGYRLAQRVLAGDAKWLEEGIL